MPEPSSTTTSPTVAASAASWMRRAPESSELATISVRMVSSSAPGLGVAQILEEVQQVDARLAHAVPYPSMLGCAAGTERTALAIEGAGRVGVLPGSSERGTPHEASALLACDDRSRRFVAGYGQGTRPGSHGSGHARGAGRPRRRV